MLCCLCSVFFFSRLFVVSTLSVSLCVNVCSFIDSFFAGPFVDTVKMKRFLSFSSVFFFVFVSFVYYICPFVSLFISACENSQYNEKPMNMLCAHVNFPQFYCHRSSVYYKHVSILSSKYHFSVLDPVFIAKFVRLLLLFQFLFPICSLVFSSFLQKFVCCRRNDQYLQCTFFCKVCVLIEKKN